MQRGWLKLGLFRLPFFICISYGFLYFSYKYYIPDLGGNDFFNYYEMYLHPFDYEVTGSPRVYRQLTALVVHLVWKLGVFYDTTIAFSRPGYDKHVFFAAIFTNYVALTISAVVVTYTADKVCAQKREPWSILAGMLCFFCFFAQQAVLTGLTEGISWLLVAVGFLGYVRRSLVPICAILCLSVIQRETIPVVFGVLGAVGLVFSKRNRSFDGVVLSLSLASFLAYILMRSVFIPVPGTDEDDLSAYLPTILSSLSSLEAWQHKMTKDLMFQIFLSQNLLILMTAALTAVVISRSFKGIELPLFPTAELSVFVAGFTFIILGLASNVNNNIGRYLSVLTPIAAPILVRNLASLFPCGAGVRSRP